MIEYTGSLSGIGPDDLRGGFFEGWPDPPSPETHLRLLENSDALVLALEESGAVVWFVTAITDGVLCAYIPLLEVLPAYRGGGAGSYGVCSPGLTTCTWWTCSATPG